MAALRHTGNSMDEGSTAPVDRRGLAAGICLVGAALAGYGAQAVQAGHGNAWSGILAQVAAHRGAELLAGSLNVLCAVFLILGAVALASIVQGRGAVLTTVGACMLALGSIWQSSAMAWTQFLPYVGTAPGVSHPAALTFLTAVDNSGTATVLLPFYVAVTLGPIVLGLGLWRARVAPIWPIGLWILGQVVFLATEGRNMVEFVGFGMLSLALIWMGVSLLRFSAAPRERRLAGARQRGADERTVHRVASDSSAT